VPDSSTRFAPKAASTAPYLFGPAFYATADFPLL
jgi:hypothetical protein